MWPSPKNAFDSQELSCLEVPGWILQGHQVYHPYLYIGLHNPSSLCSHGQCPSPNPCYYRVSPQISATNGNPNGLTTAKSEQFTSSLPTMTSSFHYKVHSFFFFIVYLFGYVRPSSFGVGLVAQRHVGSSRTSNRICVPCIDRQSLIQCTTREVP